MNKSRRIALIRAAAHGQVFETDVASRTLGIAMAADGLVKRQSNGRRRVVLIITDSGKALARSFGEPCFCCHRVP